MRRVSLNSEFIEKFQRNNRKKLNKLVFEINKILENKRDVMYSDIINYINRSDFSNQDYNEIILWCNLKIRLGKIFVDFDTLENE
jgi:hypothetical protein